MINTVLQLSTPVLIVGGLACSTLIPAIEAALRAIIATGQLLHNRCQYCYAKVAFRPENSFTTSSEYRIGRKCLMKHIEVIEKTKNLESCMYDVNKPNSKLKLQFGDQSFEVDRELFKKYSTQYKELSQDFDAFNDKIGSDADDQTPLCVVPSETFTEKSFYLLKSYLTNKNLFTELSPELRKLDLEKFIDLYKLSIYLQIPDLEARCVRIIKEYIDDGRIDIDQFYDDLKDGKYHEKYNIQDESFKNLLVDIKNFKKDYYNQELKNRIDLLDFRKGRIVKIIADQVAFATLLIFASMIPFLGPTLVHIDRGMSRSEPSYSLSVTNIIVLSLGLGACVTGAAMVLSVTVFKVSQFVVASLSAPVDPNTLTVLLLILLLNRRYHP